MEKMSQTLNVFLILWLILSINSWINCETKSNTISNSQITQVVEKHSENIRLWMCRKGQPITPEQWASLKSECINPKLQELMPESVSNAWGQCNEKVVDLCDETQWMEGKECAKDILQDEDIGAIQVWYRGRVRQMNSNFQVIKNCYQQQRKSV